MRSAAAGGSGGGYAEIIGDAGLIVGGCPTEGAAGQGSAGWGAGESEGYGAAGGVGGGEGVGVGDSFGCGGDWCAGKDWSGRRWRGRGSAATGD